MIKIDDNKKLKSRYSNVDRIVNMIKNNGDLCKFICRYFTQLDLLKVTNQADKVSLLNDIFFDYEINDMIQQSEFDMIKDDLVMFDYHMRGYLLERLFYQFGSSKLEYKNVGVSCESRIYHSSIKTNHNLDIIFYDSDLASKQSAEEDKILISKDSEYHECKNNICNWLPCKKKDLYRGRKYKEVKRKLKFIDKVDKITKQEGKFYIPTFAANVTAKQEFLNDLGATYITILNIDDVIKRCLA